MRVAVTQFATSSSLQENLSICIRIIDKASACEPSIIILPECCNTYSRYDDYNEAWKNALSMDDPFFQLISQKAIKYKCYILLNVTIRRDAAREHIKGVLKSNISVTSCLYSPCGELIFQEDKQVLVGQENPFIDTGEQALDVIPTPLGKLGFMSGNESMTFTKARQLALKGASLLCNSISTFSLDQSDFHDPTRAMENKVYIATANTIGRIYANDCSEGIGQSKIISPQGKVLAKLDPFEEGFTFADIDAETECVNKLRQDGTDMIKQRRPELYKNMSTTMQSHDHSLVPTTANVALFATYKSNEEAIEDVCHYIINNLSDIIQLPELFFINDKTITNNIEQRNQIEILSQKLIQLISAELRPFQYVCTSLIIDGIHQAVIINENGLFATQQQLHFCQRYHWTMLGDHLNMIELPLEQGVIHVAMLTGDDASIPELFQMASLSNIQVLLIPFDIQEANEAELCLASRAAEHRVCIVAGTREKSLSNGLTDNKSKEKSHKSTGLIVNLTTDSDLLSQWKKPKFKGYINQPLIKYQHGKITKAVIHPIATCE